MKNRWLIVPLLLTTLCAPAFGGASPSAKPWTQKQFIVTFWCSPPPTDEALARVAAEGFTLTETPPEGLDAVARHGLRAMVQSSLLKPEVLDDPVYRPQLDALIERVKNHPAMEAYYIKDEPGAGTFPAYGKLFAYLRERDPAHYAYINLYPSYANEQQLGVSADAAERARVGYPENFAGVGTDDKTVLRYREHVKQFVEIVKPELISYDHYHFLDPDKDGKPVDGKQYFLNLALIRMAALEAKKPFQNIIQANTIHESWRLPNAHELRFLVFTTLAYGGRGISYFTYWGPPKYNGLYQDGQPAPLLGPVVALNKEINSFGPTLLQLDSTAVYHTAPLPYGAEAVPANAPVQITSPGEFVLGLFGKAGARRPTAFMSVNRDYIHESEATLKVGLPGRKLQEFDRKTGQWVAFQSLGASRTANIKLAPGDGRLFRVAGVRLASPKDSSD